MKNRSSTLSGRAVSSCLVLSLCLLQTLCYNRNMKIYAIRHGLTINNKLKVLNGQRSDEPLEPEGIIQAQEAISKIPKSIKKIYASPMLRTRQTAEIINKGIKADLQHRDELKEVDFGTFSGRPWTEIMDEHGAAIKEVYLNQNYDFTPFDGESVTQVRNRLIKLINEIKLKEKDQEVLLVTHGGIIRAMYYIFKNELLKNNENTALHEFEV